MRFDADRDVTDFLPDALAIRHEKLPRWASSSVLWLAGVFLLALLWAWAGKVDVIVGAGGRLVTDHPTIVMKPLERTVIKRVHAGVGDRVKAGDVLVTFDPVFSRAELERLASDVRIYEALFERLLAEFEGRDYGVLPAGSDEQRWQASLFRDRQRFYKERMEYFSREILRIEQTKRSLEENIAVQKNRLKGYREIEDMLSRAMKSQAASLRILREAELTRMQLEADISDRENQILMQDSERQARIAERDAFKSDWRIRTSEEMVKVREALISARKQYDKAMQMASYVELRAPEDAVVHDVAALSIGSAVREAETLMTLVPLGGKLEVEAEIRADDIGKVRVGDSVRVKVSAFPFQKYGTLEGRVRVVSEDAFPRRPEEGKGGSFYRARIELTGGEGQLKGRLIPGMETQSEIRAGERRIIEYLVHPIIKSLDEAIREP